MITSMSDRNFATFLMFIGAVTLFYCFFSIVFEDFGKLLKKTGGAFTYHYITDDHKVIGLGDEVSGEKIS